MFKKFLLVLAAGSFLLACDGKPKDGAPSDEKGSSASTPEASSAAGGSDFKHLLSASWHDKNLQQTFAGLRDANLSPGDREGACWSLLVDKEYELKNLAGQEEQIVATIQSASSNKLTECLASLLAKLNTKQSRYHLLHLCQTSTGAKKNIVCKEVAVPNFFEKHTEEELFAIVQSSKVSEQHRVKACKVFQFERTHSLTGHEKRAAAIMTQKNMSEELLRCLTDALHRVNTRKARSALFDAFKTGDLFVKKAIAKERGEHLLFDTFADAEKKSELVQLVGKNEPTTRLIVDIFAQSTGQNNGLFLIRIISRLSFGSVIQTYAFQKAVRSSSLMFSDLKQVPREMDDLWDQLQKKTASKTYSAFTSSEKDFVALYVALLTHTGNGISNSARFRGILGSLAKKDCIVRRKTYLGDPNRASPECLRKTATIIGNSAKSKVEGSYQIQFLEREIKDFQNAHPVI